MYGLHAGSIYLIDSSGISGQYYRISGKSIFTLSSSRSILFLFYFILFLAPKVVDNLFPVRIHQALRGVEKNR